MEIKKALIVKKEHLDKIFDEGKVWEMRATRTKVRGKIGLIESGTGLIVGEVEIFTCHGPISPSKDFTMYEYHKVKDLSLLRKWKYAWALKNAKRYDKPIPYKHPRGAVIWVNLTNN
jgi:hypothetical protein